MRKYFILLLFLTFILSSSTVFGQWYREYEQGLENMEKGDYNAAIENFLLALKGNNKESKRVRTYGMHFIEYYPHRELGISLYHMGDAQKAQKQLNISMKQEASPRAKEYLDKIKSGGTPLPTKRIMKKPEVEVAKEPPPTEDAEMIVGQKTVRLVGERLSIAVFPFENKGASKDLGEIILDKMITVLHNQGRFEMMERSQMNRVLEEQQLGMSGVVDATTAAEIGKSIGVDAIVLGSVAATQSGAISVDSRLVDTESAAIVAANDAYSGSADIQSVKNIVETLARKITDSLPLVEGYIIRIDGDKLTLDTGRNSGLNKGMKCHVYKEGAEMIHPITGKSLGKPAVILGELLITDVFREFSVAKVIKADNNQQISIGDKFLTK